MSFGTSQGSTTTTGQSAPWSVQQPYLQQGFQQAANNFQNKQPQYYQNSTVAGFTPAQQQAQQMMMNTAQGPMASTAAQGQLSSTENGSYLNPSSNPYLSGAVGAANSAITDAYQTATSPQLASQFAGAGRYGSGAMASAQNMAQQGLARQLGNTDAGMYQQNYMSERQNQMTAAGLAPSIDNQQYVPAQMVGQVGNQQQTQNQNQLTDNVNRWNFNQQEPTTALNNYMGQVTGNYGGQSSQSSPYFVNNTATTLGGLAGAGAVYGMGSQQGWW